MIPLINDPGVLARVRTKRVSSYQCGSSTPDSMNTVAATLVPSIALR
jgi:hypothetical protein